MYLIISFLVLLFLVAGVIAFLLRRSLITSTEGALQRLHQEIEKANKKQSELSQRIKEADQDLAKRQQEAKELADKMKSEAEEESTSEREKLIANARKEGEEIIAKAQGAKEKIKEELEKDFAVKVINCSMEILNEVLSAKAKGSLNDVLIDEFLLKLKDTDMSRISADIKEAEIVTVSEIPESKKSEFSSVIEERLGRKVSLKVSIDSGLAGGAMLKFGSMALDGSVKNFIREKALHLQQATEA